MLNSFRSRMLIAALVPVFVVVLAIVGIFWQGRASDLDAAHSQRTRLLVSQLALSSEYGLFSGNVSNLQTSVAAILREPDVRWVAVFDHAGHLLASGGEHAQPRADFNVLTAPEQGRSDDLGGRETLVRSVTSGKVVLDDLFSAHPEPSSDEPVILGYVALEVARDALIARERYLLLVAVAVGVVGLLLGGFLALRLGQRVVQPVDALSRRIERIGQGDFLVRNSERDNDPLIELHRGLDFMAQRLSWGRDELEQRVAEATRQLRLKKEEAETATLAKSRFLAAASHDLRQPTHALGLFVARLSQLPLDTQAGHLVRSLDASVQAMQNLLDGLLDLSRLEAGAVQVQVTPVCLNDLLDALCEAFKPLALEKKLRLRVRATSLWGHSDGVLLQRMLMNLAHNALRYTPQGTVLVCCRRVDGGRSVRIDVLDSGIGISVEHQTEVFREFFQVGNQGRDRTKGLGLGLNIVQRSAHLLGHQVSVRSNLGCGTRFSITLPLASAQARPVPASVLPVAVSTAGACVLVLEDDDFSRDAMGELLQAWGYQVCPASTLAQAQVFMAEGRRVDVIVSDFRLEDGDNGLQAIASLRAIANRPLPACLMSGDTDGALMQSAKNAGLSLLHKPVRPAKLRSLLRHLLAPEADA